MNPSSDTLFGILILAMITGGFLMVNRQRWTLPENGLPYARTIANAEYDYGIPPYLLARLLHQESRFRPDIITGRTRSPAGAIGIAQIIPRWHPELGEDGALDPSRAIYYAARYLRQNYNRFGTWERALAAYNWGPTILNSTLNDYGDRWFAFAPAETRNYINQILDDVPDAKGEKLT